MCYTKVARVLTSSDCRAKVHGSTFISENSIIDLLGLGVSHKIQCSVENNEMIDHSDCCKAFRSPCGNDANQTRGQPLEKSCQTFRPEEVPKTKH